MNRKWWKESVVYQVYPRSFKDSNGDGIGDLQGIISKLDYLKELGIDVIWLSPVYHSPNADNGYDISDYKDIMDEFGTMEDFDQLLAEAHKMNIKIVMDLVANHTSDEHKWFIESRKSKENPYRDYYWWRPAKDGKEPNNWVSIFGGSAWEYDNTTDEYYLHLFATKQPDLNWENPLVREEIHKMMRWWLDKGIDGFRFDAINVISKVEGIPDAPVSTDDPYQWGGQYFFNGPRMHEFMHEIKEKVTSNYDILTVAETSNVTTEEGIRFTNEETGSVNMLFHFEHMDIDAGPGGKWDTVPWKLKDLKNVMTKWQKELEGQGWNSLYLNNHDQPRVVSRWGNDQKYRVESAKMLGTFLHMMQGTPYVYQGEELGMTNVQFDSIKDYQDVEIINYYNEQVKQKGKDEQKVMEAIYIKGRDNARTPMQWDASKNAGFTSGIPWLKVNENYREINAKQQLVDPNSVFNYYRELISLRKEYPIMVYGTYDLILEDHEQIYAYTRTLENEKLLVILNFTEQKPVFELPNEIIYKENTLLISNYSVAETEGIEKIELKPYEARVYRLQG